MTEMRESGHPLKPRLGSDLSGNAANRTGPIQRRTGCRGGPACSARPSSAESRRWTVTFSLIGYSPATKMERDLPRASSMARRPSGYQDAAWASDYSAASVERARVAPRDRNSCAVRPAVMSRTVPSRSSRSLNDDLVIVHLLHHPAGDRGHRPLRQEPGRASARRRRTPVTSSVRPRSPSSPTSSIEAPAIAMRAVTTVPSDAS